MPTVEYACEIEAPLERVWAFHEDVHGSLPKLCRPGDEVKLESVDLPPRVGMRVVITARGPFGRVRWVAVYEEYVPPHPVAFGYEARFADVQESGPFKSWRHAHEFEYVDERTTRLTDRITYRVPFGPFGWIVDLIFLRRKLAEMFRYRHAATRRLLEE
jgi:hypothetical protein